MANKWTVPQSQAIEARDMSIIVSAAAGSGKTAVLVERVVSLLTDKVNPIDIDDLVLATFSKAAAKEMSHRISTRLREIYTSDKSLHIGRQIQKLPKANISTVHSLCFNLIKDNFHSLGLSPNVHIGDTRELDIMQKQAITTVMECHYNSGDEAFAYLMELMSHGRDDRAFIKIVEDMYKFLRSYPFYRNWLEEMKEEYSAATKPQYTPWGKVIMEDTLSRCKYIKNLLVLALEEANKEEKLYNAYGGAIMADLDQINLILNELTTDNWEAVAERLANVAFPRLGSATKCEDISAKEKSKQLRDMAKDLLGKLAKKDLFCDSKEFKTQMDFILPLINTLFDIVGQVDDENKAIKTNSHMVDFSDLEHYALDLLVEMGQEGYTSTAVAEAFSNNIYQVLVDEYQDTNQVQDMIFKSLSEGGKKLFMVGDVKQSIYGFRQAKPDIFLEKKNQFPAYEEKSHEGKIIMGNNFRSRSEITTAINYIFTMAMTKEAGGIDYNEEEWLYPSAQFPAIADVGCEIAVIDSDIDEESLGSRVIEADYIAVRIKEMIDRGDKVASKTGTRAIMGGDVAILLRSTAGKSEIYQKALKELGIDSVVELEDGFLSTVEINCVLAMLKAVENPLLNLELATALMSPLFGFTAEEMGEISLNQTDIPLYSRMQTHKDKPKVEKFFSVYDRISTATGYLSVSQIIYLLYDLTDCEAVYSMMKNGAVALANLRLLSDYSKEFEKSGYKGLSAFVNFVNKIIESGSDLTPASTVTANPEAVKIMSIHKSKGLEFPVVFLADTKKQFNNEDSKKSYLIHPELGFGCMRKDSKLGVQYNTLPLSAIRIKNKKEQLDEELRILYVAMTRAKEKLIITPVVKNPSSKLKKLAIPLSEGKLSAGQVMSFNSYSDIILSAMVHHSDGVILRSLGEFFTDEYKGSSGEFIIKIVDEELIAELHKEEDIDVSKEAREISQEIVEDIIRKASFIYPYEKFVNLPTGLAVSMIGKEEIVQDKLFTSQPRFIKDKGLTGAQRGTAVHKFMQFAHYEQANVDINKELERLVQWGYLGEEEAQSVDIKKLQQFFASPLYNRMTKADSVLREYGFFADVGNEVLSQYTNILPEGTKVALQGIADCIILEGDTAIIVDYKSDYVKDINHLKERYQIQLGLYKTILKEFLDCSQVEAVIYSFSLGQYVQV